METLDCGEVDYEIIDSENETKIKLNLPPIKDDEFPTVSVLVPTYNRPEFFELIMRNFEAIDYPKEKLELIVCDDTPKATKHKNLQDNIKYFIVDKKMTIGEKRNFLCSKARHEYIAHMDDDDWYPSESIACRIRILLEYEKFTGQNACFGCTKVLCLDIINGRMFEAFDSSVDGFPATISESTMAYSKAYWNKQQFDDGSNFAECLPFIKGRQETVCSGPSVFIVTQFTHQKNSIQRRVEKSYVSEFNYIRFEQSLSTHDIQVFNNVRAQAIKNIPEYKQALDFIFRNKDQTFEKIKKEYKQLDNDIKSNQLIINLYREKMVTKTTTTGKDIVYYCGPGKYMNLTKKWCPDSLELGGSEEAVINLSKEFVKNGYNVTVYCSLKGSSKVYDGVLYKNYYEWIPKDRQDTTIIWRDPSNCLDEINSKNVLLDLHDAVDPDWLKDVKKKVRIMTKSNYHCEILGLKGLSDSFVIPNGIYKGEVKCDEKVKNLMVCTSSPDRCLRALLRALPLIRQSVPDAEIHWAYGFSSSIDEHGGMDKNPRTKKWVEESRELIKNTPGFVDLGRLSQKDVNGLYNKADVFIYASRFPEIDCISLTKALSFGCVPVVTPNGAIAEKLDIPEQYAKLVNGQIDYSLENGPEFKKFVKAVVHTLQEKRTDKFRQGMSKHTNNNYSWELVASKWINFM